MIWSAVLVHLKGRALWFQSLIHSSSAWVSSSREQNTPRSRQRRCNAGAGLAVDLVQKVAEVHRPVLGGQRADHLAGGDVQRREQVDGAMPHIAEAAPPGHPG